MEGFYNGGSQKSTVWTGSYLNDDILIGVQHNNLTKLTGHIQEIQIFDSDISDDIGSVHTNINSFYTIY